MVAINAYAKGEGVERDEQQAAKWEVLQFDRTDSRDVSIPTLQRTLLHGTIVSDEQAGLIKNAAAQKIPLAFIYVPSEEENAHLLENIIDANKDIISQTGKAVH